MDLITQIYSSIFRVQAYRHFKEQSAGRVFLYLLVVVIIFGSVGLLQLCLGFNQGIDQMVKVYQQKAPQFVLENGELNVPGKMPMIIVQDERSCVIIDTTGQTDPAFLEEYAEGCLITKQGLQIKNRNQVRQFLFKDFKQFYFTKEKLGRLLPGFKWLMVLIVIFGWAWLIVTKLFSALIVAVLGLILVAIQQTQLKFSALYKLSIYGLTLPIIIQNALQAAGLSMPGFFLIYYGIALIYLGLAIRQIKGADGEITLPSNSNT